MQRLITRSREWFSDRLRAIALVSLVGIMGWLMLASQPAYAAEAQRASTPTVDKTMTAEPRDQAYDEALEVIDNPNGVQNTYEENLKQYRQENPDQGGVVAGAKELVEKITPNRK
ncbi:hypothetical protein IQ273_07860 [Nodosilinea sp. LEGE 07298]|uniref:hypothetical protein n=1 Tax=Nodosilinea sp. LEGE 07298 TaxID=2777970 RepID=UPI0018812C02|nr:hypothetical protein [Nodosilinea sp. LEGE 07298]MBE9109329.1 hypothetical protein [Nodosilinea sp. LEGE 07298]